MKDNKRIRLYVENTLKIADCCDLSSEQSHYLCNVMRCKEGDFINCFNELCGEFLSKIVKLNKKHCVIEPQKQIRNDEKTSDLWLLFAPLKKDKTDFVIEKATELGVSKIVPVITKYTNSGKVNTERFLAQAKEAAEQCERLSIPSVEKATSLKDILNNWDDKRIMFFMNERRGSLSLVEAFGKNANLPAAVLIGPEGGFSDEEAKLIEKYPFVKSVHIGTRILRAETAAVSSLAVWQACVGDWK